MGPGLRIAYFTAISDILEDIQDKYPQLEDSLDLPQSTSQKRKILSEFYCPGCSYPENNLSTPHSSGVDSDEMSVMSIFSDEPANYINIPGDAAGTNPSALETSTMTQLESDEVMSVDSGDVHVSFSPIYLEEFEELLDLLPPASNQDVALEIALDPFQLYGNMEHDFGVDDETLLIDEDGSDAGRSSAHRKKLHYSASRDNLGASWAMVGPKPRATAKKASKVSKNFWARANS